MRISVVRVNIFEAQDKRESAIATLSAGGETVELINALLEQPERSLPCLYISISQRIPPICVGKKWWKKQNPENRFWRCGPLMAAFMPFFLFPAECVLRFFTHPTTNLVV